MGANQIQLGKAHTIMLCQSMSYSRDTIKVAESLNSHLEKLCFGIWKDEIYTVLLYFQVPKFSYPNPLFFPIRRLCNIFPNTEKN